MNLIVCSDLHLNVYSKYSRPLNHRYVTNTNLRHEFAVLDSIFQLAVRRHAAVVFNGDFFDQRGHIDTRVMNLAMAKVCRYAKKVPIYFNSGNHDQLNNSRIPPSSLDAFEWINGVKVFDQPGVIRTDGVDLVMIPYSNDVSWLKRQIRRIAVKVTRPAVEFFHLGIAGSRNTSHLVKLSGAFSLEDLCPDRYDYVVGGHYHLRQKLGPNAWYVGSTIPHEHADDFQQKGVDLVSINPSGDSHRLIPIKSPMFYTFDLAKRQVNRSQIVRLSKQNVVKVITHDQSTARWYSDHTKCEIDDEAPVKYHSRLNLKSTATPGEIVKKYCQHYYDQPTARKALQILERVTGE